MIMRVASAVGLAVLLSCRVTGGSINHGIDAVGGFVSPDGDVHCNWLWLSCRLYCCVLVRCTAAGALQNNISITAFLVIALSSLQLLSFS